MGNLIRSYGNENLHRKVGNIIKAHSTNREDIRAVVRRSLEWSAISAVLDVGCGYGWLEGSFSGGFEKIFGIDALEENRKTFLATVDTKAREVGFQQVVLPAALHFPDKSFDLVIAAYSLYFFPGILPEVRRLLKGNGTFLAITHSEAMLEEGEEFFHFKNLRRLIKRFSAENGERKLREYFRDIRQIDYSNALVFNREDGEDMALYITFKSEFISKDADPAAVTEKLLSALYERGRLSFNKNDRIFLAKK